MNYIVFLLRGIDNFPKVVPVSRDYLYLSISEKKASEGYIIDFLKQIYMDDVKSPTGSILDKNNISFFLCTELECLGGVVYITTWKIYDY